MSLPEARPVSEQQIASMFNKIAPRYDLLNRLLSARQDQRWRAALVRRIPYRPSGRMLDVATGTGDVVLAASRARTEYAEFFGVDISRAMLQIAMKKAERQGAHAATEFRVMSAESLDFPSDSFDCLSISFGLRNVVDKEAALREFHRVLRPDGQLLILEFFLPKRGLLSRLFQFYFKTILPRIGALLSDKSAYSYLPQSVGHFYQPYELRSLLGSLGFRVLEDKPFLFGGCRLVHAEKRST